jgi:pseudouridylate synthase
LPLYDVTSIRTSSSVKEALSGRRAPVVALESTVIAHGLPHPINLEAALACQDAIRRAGAVPATIGVVGGEPVVGLNDSEIEIFAGGNAPDGSRILKVGLNNLAGVMTRGEWGATTVASSLRIAHLAKVRVFSTGGIGGVHRDATSSFDISADLTALATIPMVCVSAGAKAILDLPGTIEYLETLGVPVVGYQTDEFPAFYSRASGLRVDVVVDSPDEAAAVAMAHWGTGGTTAILLCVPIPAENEIPGGEINRLVEEALTEVRRDGIRGKAVTPFVLSQMAKLSGGRTLAANRALLVNNARIAGRIAAGLQSIALPKGG